MTIKKIKESIYHLSTEDALGILAEQYDINPRKGILKILMDERFFRFCNKFAVYYKKKCGVVNNINYFVFFQNEPVRSTDINKICEKIDYVLKLKYPRLEYPDILDEVINSGVISMKDYLKYKFNEEKVEEI